MRSWCGQSALNPTSIRDSTASNTAAFSGACLESIIRATVVAWEYVTEAHWSEPGGLMRSTKSTWPMTPPQRSLRRCCVGCTRPSWRLLGWRWFGRSLTRIQCKRWLPGSWKKDYPTVWRTRHQPVSSGAQPSVKFSLGGNRPPTLAWEVLHKLGDGESDDERVCKSIELLLREAPLLTGRLIRMWLAPTGVPDQRQISRSKHNLLERLRFIVADVPEESISDWEWDQWEKGELCHEPQPTPLSLKDKQVFADNQQQNLLDTAAREMRVDSGFIDSIIGKVLEPLDYSSLDYRERNNAETALNNRPFRELLGLRILASMNRGG